MEYCKNRREEVELYIQQDKGRFVIYHSDSNVIPAEIINKIYGDLHLPDNIDTVIPKINSPNRFIEEINSLPMHETYPHEDDMFYIPEEYRKMTKEELIIEKEKLFKELKRRKQMKEIKIKYHSKDIEKLTYIDGKSDWIDLRAAEDVTLKAGEFKLINLGISMKLPEGYEAHIVPRSSTFKNFGIIQTNHQAVIDNSYCGDNDIWRYPAYALKDTEIKVNDRICQFRIVENQPKIQFEEVEFLDGQDRGGIGSTGKQ